MAETIDPFALAVPDSVLDDLRRRLDATRWPIRETVADWSQGAPLEKVRALCAHWRDRYDWRACEARLNAFGQFRTALDGLGIHFLHVRSPYAGARPLLLTHGWPGSVVEFLKVIGPLTDPVAFGGTERDAFHVVVPSLPGYGFSDAPAESGWSVERIARAWITLMDRLGYRDWIAQGGDWGALVTSAIGIARPAGCSGIHLNMCVVPRDAIRSADPTPAERETLASIMHHHEWDSGYSKQQSTRPQTLGYGLADSPVGQAAWIYEKMWAWTDNRGAPEDVLSLDEMLDNIMLYWLSNSGASSARLYWESFRAIEAATLELPLGVSIFPREIMRPSRRWVEQTAKNLVYWNEVGHGGHFAAWEQPALFVDELRRFSVAVSTNASTPEALPPGVGGEA